MSNSDKFTRNARSKETGAQFTLQHAFSCAWAGIVHVIASERNMKIHLIVAAIALLLSYLLKLSLVEFCIVLICIVLVMALECVNTALECVVDLVSPEWHLLAKRAKDAAAGAVYIAAIGAFIVGLCLFVPPILALIA